MNPKVAVIQFPGVNCEYETVRALSASGLDAEVFRWNLELSRLSGFDAFILPGGFSYQDRIRAGAVAAKDSIMEEISVQSGKGKPVLGICNGAQVLIESGLVPGLSEGRVEMALGPNAAGGRSGYLCEWIYVKVTQAVRSAFTCGIEEGEILPLPIAHAEGRFLSASQQVIEKLQSHKLVRLVYCDHTGNARTEFPWNPNGSMLSAAAICNKAGNVMAMMPHPERASWLMQVPDWIHGPWGAGKLAARGRIDLMQERGPGRQIFGSLRRFLGS